MSVLLGGRAGVDWHPLFPHLGGKDGARNETVKHKAASTSPVLVWTKSRQEQPWLLAQEMSWRPAL
jgi:hypothetical protein